MRTNEYVTRQRQIHTTRHAARKFEREYTYMQAGNHLLSKDEWTFIHQQCCSSNGRTDRRRLFKKKRPRHYQRLHLYSDILQAHFLFRIKNHQQIEASPQTFYWLKPLKKTLIISTRHFKSLRQLLKINNQSNLTRINILRPCSN